MGRPATGTIVEPKTPGEIWALRIPAYGDRPYIPLGTSADGWTWKKADEERQNIMADVRRGTWVPPEANPTPKEPDGLLDPLYHDWAESWFEAGEAEWDDKTIKDYKWALENHLLPYFGDKRLSEITIEEVDAYRVWKQTQARTLIAATEAEGRKPKRGKKLKVTGALSSNSVNKTISRLGTSLKKPVEYPKFKIASNPALGEARKAKSEKPDRPRLHVEQIPFFVAAADGFMRPLVAISSGVASGSARRRRLTGST